MFKRPLITLPIAVILLGCGGLEFRVRLLEIEAGGKPIAVMGEGDARRLGVKSSDRVLIRLGDSEATAILNIASEFPEGVLGAYRELRAKLKLVEGAQIQVEPIGRPESLSYIREKILGERLTPWKIDRIVQDVVEQHLSDVELAAFVTALQIHGMSMEEVEALSWAMVKRGRTLNLGRHPILDKHSVGGVPGDKTTLLVVPIIAASGYTIPKTSSRAITSPAGTADRMEPLCPVDLRLEEILRVVEEVNACIVWGGALDLAPADDLFIRVEYPLSIDPLLLPSIMAKKKAMGSTHMVVDIPTGRGAKIKTMDQAQQLAMDFIELGRRLGIVVECAITEGDQPIGRAVGPALEAREALEALMGNGPPDLIDKAASLAGILFRMFGDENGKEKALSILNSGRALEKMREIIGAQGGDPDVRPEDIPIGERVHEMRADRGGRVLWIDNSAIAQIARAAGAPSDKGAGLILNAKMGDEVDRGDVILRIHAESPQRLEWASSLARSLEPMGIGERVGERMLIREIRAVTPLGPEFILER
jgi:AMP phosphorylase